MKNFKFISLLLTLFLTLNTIPIFANSNSNLSAAWRCTETYSTSDKVGLLDVYTPLSSVLASSDGYSMRESDFELHAGDVLEVSACVELINNDYIREGDSADHFVTIYCGDTVLGELIMPIYGNSHDNKYDSITVTIPKEAISSSGGNYLKIRYGIGTSYFTCIYTEDIYVNGQYLENSPLPLSAAWKCVESYATSDDDLDPPDREISIYDDVYSKQGAGIDGFTNRASDFELHAGDVIEISAYAGFDYGEPISEYNSADHRVDVYCGDTNLGGLFLPVYSDLETKRDSEKIVVTKNDISVSGNNNLRIEYTIGNFYHTYVCIDDIYINGEHLY